MKDLHTSRSGELCLERERRLWHRSPGVRERKTDRRERKIEREEGSIRKMGKKTAAVETNKRWKKKKKGRPSLLDLQKRSLRLQKQQEEEEQQKHQRNPNPNSKDNSNPYLRYSSPASSRRGTRRNPVTESGPREEEEGEEEDEEDSGKRREKKLKFVLRLPSNAGRNRAELDSCGSESDGDGSTTRSKKRRIVGEGSVREKTERPRSLSKATEGEMVDLETGTPLPDKTLLVFILDRLQKKDTYGVFSEPVDPEELPDYHEIIENPMDFSTVRKKLANGGYASLEQFEEDVFLISSNAMRYNSPDTIYFRQARSIQELARKDFENLRQESDDNETEPKVPEPKVVRRGRPPTKNITRKPVGRSPPDRSNPNAYSITSHANSYDKAPLASLNDMSRKGLVLDKSSIFDQSLRVSQLTHNSENYNWVGDKKLERNEEPSGSMFKASSTRHGKKVVISEENRRHTYISSTASVHEQSVLMTFDGERRELVPVGLLMEHAYARSLARFAASLGPTGWEVAARQIERVLPPGTKFGRGWVGEKDVVQSNQPPLLSTSSSNSVKNMVSQSPSDLKTDCVPERLDSSSSLIPSAQSQPSMYVPPFSLKPAIPNRASHPAEASETSKASSIENKSTALTSDGIRPKSPFQVHQNLPGQPNVNGFNSGFAYGHPQVGQALRPSRLSGSLAPEVSATHVQALDTISGGSKNFVHPAMTGHFEAERRKMVNSGTPNAKNNFHHQSTVSSNVDMDRAKYGSANPVTNSFSNPSTSNNLDAERTNMNNSNTVKLGSNRLIQPSVEQSDAESAKLNKTSTSDFGNRHMHYLEPSNQLEAQRTISGNSNPMKSSTGFTHLSGREKGHSESEMATKFLNPCTKISTSTLPPESTQNSQGVWHGSHGLSLHSKPESAAPDLNVRFQSPGSPASGAPVETQQPDLALQL